MSVDPFLAAAAPSGKYLPNLKNPGESHTLQITGPWTARDQEFKGVKATYMSGPRAGQVKQEYLIPGDAWDEETQSLTPSILTVKAGRMMSAVGQALKAVGAGGLEIGGVLTLEFTGYGQAQGGNSAPKEFKATYVPPKPEGGAWGEDEGDDD